MTKALSAKNNLGFVEGSIPEPSNPDSPLFQAWRCNDMVHEVCKDLKCAIYSEKWSKTLELKKALACHTQGSLTVGEMKFL